MFKIDSIDDTVDGRNPPPVDMLDIPLYTGFFLNPIHHHLYIPLKMQGSHMVGKK